MDNQRVKFTLAFAPYESGICKSAVRIATFRSIPLSKYRRPIRPKFQNRRRDEL